MNPAYISLSPGEVGIAVGLILVNVAISVVLKLDLERKLVIAAVRTVVQLVLVGYVLEWVFQTRQWYVVVIVAVIMTLAAGHAASDRGAHSYHGMFGDGLISVGVSSWIITAIGLYAIVHVHPWYEPQYLIPILGMVLGNALTGVSLGLERITQELVLRRDQVETLLCLGATRYEAALVPIRNAVRAGVMPAINAMTVVGLVTLPGMMTGQVLAGQAPSEAVRYQIVVMFLIGAASALGTGLAVLFVFRRTFSSDHRFHYAFLSAKKRAG